MVFGLVAAEIVLWIASSLRYLARHARDRTGAAGVAATTATLLPYPPVANSSSVLGGEMVLLTASRSEAGAASTAPNPKAERPGKLTSSSMTSPTTASRSPPRPPS
jgi:hypothetical protein